MSKTMGLNLSPEEIEAVKAYFKKSEAPPHRRRAAVDRPGLERALLLQVLQVLPAGAHLHHQAPRRPGQGGRRGHGVRRRARLRAPDREPQPPLGHRAVRRRGHRHRRHRRDVLAMGAQPIALVDPLFFGPLELREVPAGVKLPKYLDRRRGGRHP